MALHSAIPVAATRWPDQLQGPKSNVLAAKTRTRTTAPSPIATNTTHKNKKRKEKDYSAPKKNAIVTNCDRKVLPQSDSDVKESRGERLLESLSEEEKKEIDGDVLGLAGEEEKPRGTEPPLWLASSDFVMDDRRRRLVEMANRYLLKQRPEDDYYGGDDGSPTKRQRLGDEAS